MPKLMIGDTLPEFTVDTAYAEGLSLRALLKKADTTVLWVLRYIGCTSCRYDVHCIAERYAEFTARGAQVLVVMQGEAAEVRASLAESPLPFDIICDTKQALYDALTIEAVADKALLGPASETEKARFAKKRADITALGFTHGKYEGNELQLPALFVLDPAGRARYVHYAANIADMPDVDGVLALLG